MNLTKNYFQISGDIDQYIGDFKYGALYGSGIPNFPYDQSKHKFKISIINKSERQYEYNKRTSFFYSIAGEQKANLIQQRRSFPFGGEAYFELKEFDSDNVEISFNNLYKIWSISRLSKIFPIGNILTDITTTKLLNNQILSFHGACIEFNGAAHIICGLPDVGKSYTTLNLLNTYENIKYMSEDILLIDQNNIATSVPLTQTLLKRGTQSMVDSVYESTHDFFFKKNYIKTHPYNIFDNLIGKTSFEAKVNTVFYLKRGESKISEVNTKFEKQSIINTLLKLNHLEFTYFKNEMLLSYLFFNCDYSILEVMDIERQLVNSLIENTNIVILSSNKPSEYSNMIAKYLHF